MQQPWTDCDDALLELIFWLRDQDYDFATPTPQTHAIFIGRQPGREAKSDVDVLGWSRPFRPGSIDRRTEQLLRRAQVLEVCNDLVRATVRVSRLGNDLFLHSAFPTTAPDAVFFGPDSYRFARFLSHELAGRCARSLVDIGSGSGVGAIIAARISPGAAITMTDINPAALRFARINAAAAGINPRLHLGDILADVIDPIETAIANPPYIMDSSHRAYRDGGDLHGSALSLRMIECVLGRLESDGRFLLYTGSAIVNGRDSLRERALALAHAADCSFHYDEIDPDVFGEELLRHAYRTVDRIAVVGAVFVRK